MVCVLARIHGGPTQCAPRPTQGCTRCPSVTHRTVETGTCTVPHCRIHAVCRASLSPYRTSTRWGTCRTTTWPQMTGTRRRVYELTLLRHGKWYHVTQWLWDRFIYLYYRVYRCCGNGWGKLCLYITFVEYIGFVVWIQSFLFIYFWTWTYWSRSNNLCSGID